MAKTPTSAIGTGNERGMTLLELLVVIVLLGLLAAIGAQAILGDDRRLQGVSERVEHHLRKARLSAMRSGVAMFVPCESMASSRRGEAAKADRDTGFTVSCMSAAGRERGITFFPDGSSSGEAIEFMSGRTRTRIRVDALTGSLAFE